MSAANPRTVVVLGAGGPVLMPWLTQSPRSRQLFGGQEQGDAIADVLFGDVNPSGKLPIRFPSSEQQPEQLGIANPCNMAATSTSPTTRACSSGYRGYERAAADAVPVRARPLVHAFAYRKLAQPPRQRSKVGSRCETPGAARAPRWPGLLGHCRRTCRRRPSSSPGGRKSASIPTSARSPSRSHVRRSPTTTPPRGAGSRRTGA